MKRTTLAAFIAPLVILAACASSHVTEGQGLGSLESVIDQGVTLADAAGPSLSPAANAKIAAVETKIQTALPPIRAAYAASSANLASQLVALSGLLTELYADFGGTPPAGVQALAHGQLPTP